MASKVRFDDVRYAIGIGPDCRFEFREISTPLGQGWWTVFNERSALALKSSPQGAGALGDRVRRAISATLTLAVLLEGPHRIRTSASTHPARRSSTRARTNSVAPGQTAEVGTDDAAGKVLYVSSIIA
jgi:hypothetical protein